jgi:hypothetical protein
MLRSRRALLAVIGLAALVLTACQKPVPKITVEGDGTVVTIAPSTYCFDAAHCRRSALDLPAVTVGPDQKVMVDVPREVMSRGWQVAALSLQDISKVLGTSGPITASHSYRVAGSSGNGSPFIVQVSELAGSRTDGSVWSFLVKVSQTG